MTVIIMWSSIMTSWPNHITGVSGVKLYDELTFHLDFTIFSKILEKILFTDSNWRLTLFVQQIISRVILNLKLVKSQGPSLSRPLEKLKQYVYIGFVKFAKYISVQTSPPQLYWKTSGPTDPGFTPDCNYWSKVE